MKKLYIFMLTLHLLLLFNFPALAQGKPSVVAQSAILLDTKSGEVLYAKDAQARRYPASTTKVLTAIIAIEKGKLTDIVTTSKNAAGTEGSSIWLKEGEKHTLEDLLYGILLNSANDACVAVAEHISGSVENFAGLMNAKAKEIGAKESNFVNPNGLPDDQHYTTAQDLALIGRYAMHNPVFRKIVATKVRDIPWEGEEWERRLINHNKLLWRYEGANGLKTGYTRVAQQCLVASANREGREFLAVILSSQGQNLWTDAKALLNYGFDNYSTVKIVDKDKEVKQLPVAGGVDKVVPLATGEALYKTVPLGGQVKPVAKLINLPKELEAPVAKGQKIGQVVYYDGDKEIGRVDLLAAKSINKKVFLTKKKSFSFLGLFIAAGVGLVLWEVRRRSLRRKRFLFRSEIRYRRDRW